MVMFKGKNYRDANLIVASRDKVSKVVASSKPKPGCPLCGSGKSVVVMRIPLADLRMRWSATFGFDPFDTAIGEGELARLRCSDCDLLFHDPAPIGDGAFYAKLSRFPWYYERQKWEYELAFEALLVSGPKPARIWPRQRRVPRKTSAVRSIPSRVWS